MPQDSVPAAPPIDPKRIDPDASKVVRRLSRQGYVAYLVGGCVRDLLLGVEPKDFDVATNAKPREIRRLFRNSRIIGRRFRLAHIHFGPRIIEVATFRAPPVSDDDDDPYIRRDNVYGSEKQDAFRRDFTINALFYDVERERVIDHVDGLPDLSARLLRIIGDPDVRLREDPVRILRAAKFAGRLDFELTPELHRAATDHARDLAKAAPPRILEELYRLLCGRGSARAFRQLEELGALEVLLPQIRPITEEFFASLERLEEATGGQREGAPHSLLLGVLLWPCVREQLASSGSPDPESLVHDRIAGFAQRFSIARRDIAGARHALAGQRRLAAGPRGRRSRRFAHREGFGEVIALRRIVGPLDPDEPDALDAWLALAQTREPVKPGGRRRRRRRRGGRRRRKPLSGDAPQGKDEACPPSESSSAPAPKTPPSESRRDSSSAGS